jgi:hypothetical protein
MRSSRVDQWLVGEKKLVVPAAAGVKPGYVSPDGREMYQVKLDGRGTRDLRAGMLQLSSELADQPRVERGYLLIAIRRSTVERTLKEWGRGKQVIRPEIARRLRLIAVVEGKVAIDPNDGALRELGERFKSMVSETERDSSVGSVWPKQGVGGSWKHLEVEKVLLHRWLLGKGAIAAGELAKQVGCSFPTLQHALRRLEAKGLIAREKGRSIALKRYSRERWSELFMLARSVYPPEAYVDVTGDIGGAEGLLARLRRRPVEHVAVGGVVAARRWDRSFDLNGTPRLDLVLHTPEGDAGGRGGVDAGFVRRLDPALRPLREAGRGSPILVLHRVRRREALFETDAGEPLPWAGPVETLEHLNEMGLTTQAREMLARLRPEVRH